MRIAINALASRGTLSGAARYIRSLVTSLAKVDAKNEYVLYASQDDVPLFAGLGPNFQPVPTVAIRPLRLLWEQTELPWDLKRRRVDVFHGPVFIAPFVKTCRQVVTIHDMTFFLLPQCHLFTKRHYFQRLIPRCVGRANQVIAVSESTRRDLVRILGSHCSKKIRVIYHGKDECFCPDRAAAAARGLRMKYGLLGRVILFVGLIEPRKNLERLIRAYAKLKSLHQDSCLVLAGSQGWGYEAVLRAVSESGVKDRVFFPGFIPERELPSLYNLADVFVYPSLYEGFGFPVLEAMSCGTPVVASRVSSMPEIAGDAALLVDPHDVDSIAQALERVLVDRTLRERMAEEGIRRSQPFTWERTARETLAAYEEAAGK